MPEFIYQLLIILILMVVYNFTSHKILHDKYHLPFSLSVTALVIVSATYWLNMSYAEFGYSNIIKGIIYGGGVSIFLAGIIALGSTNKYTKSFFLDSRVLGIPYKKFFKKTLLDIPIITVLFEETLFRGLILGYLLLNTSELSAIIASSVMFGFWHILPSLNYAKTNGKAKGFPLATIGTTIIVTTIAGILFAWLRVKSGSILSPMIIHYVANSGGYTASWLISKKDSKK